MRVAWLIPLFFFLFPLAVGMSDAKAEPTMTISFHHWPSRPMPTKGDMIQTAKAMEWKYNIPRGMLQAVCEQETRWRPNEVSHKGAVGVCQIMPTTFVSLVRKYQHKYELQVDGVIGPKTFGHQQPGVPFQWQSNERRMFDPYQNIEWAAFYLRWIIDNVSEDASIIMATYYGGQGNPVVRYMREVQARWTGLPCQPRET